LGITFRARAYLAEAMAIAGARPRQSLALRRALGEPLGIAQCLEGLALTADRDRAAWAARLLGAAEAIRERLGAPLPPVDRPEHDAAVAAARAALGDDGFAAAWAAGRTMTIDAATVDALADSRDHTAAVAPSARDRTAPP
jgi:hypothetical protein